MSLDRHNTVKDESQFSSQQLSTTNFRDKKDVKYSILALKKKNLIAKYHLEIIEKKNDDIAVYPHIYKEGTVAVFAQRTMLEKS